MTVFLSVQRTWHHWQATRSTYLRDEPDQGDDDAWNDVEQAIRYPVGARIGIATGCPTYSVDNQTASLYFDERNALEADVE